MRTYHSSVVNVLLQAKLLEHGIAQECVAAVGAVYNEVDVWLQCEQSCLIRYALSAHERVAQAQISAPEPDHVKGCVDGVAGVVAVLRTCQGSVQMCMEMSDRSAGT